MDHAIPAERMTADEFERWLDDRPDGGRFELAGGKVVAMAPERSIHAMLKGAAYVQLLTASRHLECQVFPDGMAVRVDDATQREPDAALRLGPRLGRDDTVYADPLVIVEVLSPSTAEIDLADKVRDYGRIETLAHYLVVNPTSRIVMHHRKDGEGFFTTILPGGLLRLDPPGIDLDLDAILSEVDR